MDFFIFGYGLDPEQLQKIHKNNQNVMCLFVWQVPISEPIKVRITFINIYFSQSGGNFTLCTSVCGRNETSSGSQNECQCRIIMSMSPGQISNVFVSPGVYVAFEVNQEVGGGILSVTQQLTSQIFLKLLFCQNPSDG